MDSYRNTDQDDYTENIRSRDDPATGRSSTRGDDQFLRQSESDPMEGNTSQRENLTGNRAPGLGGPGMDDRENMGSVRSRDRVEGGNMYDEGDFISNDDVGSGRRNSGSGGLGRSGGMGRSGGDDMGSGYGGSSGSTGVSGDHDRATGGGMGVSGGDDMDTSGGLGRSGGGMGMTGDDDGLGGRGGGMGRSGGGMGDDSYGGDTGGDSYGTDTMGSGGYSDRQTRSSGGRDSGPTGSVAAGLGGYDADAIRSGNDGGDNKKGGDSTMGKVMEKVGGMMGSHKMQQSGIDKREDEARRDM